MQLFCHLQAGIAKVDTVQESNRVEKKQEWTETPFDFAPGPFRNLGGFDASNGWLIVSCRFTRMTRAQADVCSCPMEDITRSVDGSYFLA
jgi:hypothetical protein